MRGLRELEYPYGCHWSHEVQKNGTSFLESRAPTLLVHYACCRPLALPYDLLRVRKFYYACGYLYDLMICKKDCFNVLKS